ncbi:hypothetical protein, partial [Burkholderia pseudomallei]|uniref:hypothetical protein n=1 Tax=Burkholderia pseudomallei TaxID=28450 RepID=UPI001E403D6C
GRRERTAWSSAIRFDEAGGAANGSKYQLSHDGKVKREIEDRCRLPRTGGVGRSRRRLHGRRRGASPAGADSWGLRDAAAYGRAAAVDAVIVRAASAWLTLAVDAPRFVKTRSDAPRCTQMHPDAPECFR